MNQKKKDFFVVIFLVGTTIVIDATGLNREERGEHRDREKRKKNKEREKIFFFFFWMYFNLFVCHWIFTYPSPRRASRLQGGDDDDDVWVCVCVYSDNVRAK